MIIINQINHTVHLKNIDDYNAGYYDNEYTKSEKINTYVYCTIEMEVGKAIILLYDQEALKDATFLYNG
jgi:hypothetical protein